MIALLNATRMVTDDLGPRQILAETSLVIGDRERVGILAARGSGKSMIARLLSGIERPDSGQVLRTGRVSWPMGFAGALHPDLTVAENIALIGGLLGEDAEHLVAFCELSGGLGPILHRKMKTASPAQRSAVAFCLSLGTQCDTYVADDSIGFGLDRQREMSEALLEQRLETAGLVFLSSNPQQIAKVCNRVFVLICGHLVPCQDIMAGQQALTESMTLYPRREREAEHA